MRTTLDIDNDVLNLLRRRQQEDGKSLGQLASELLAVALSDSAAAGSDRPLVWTTKRMEARVDLDDRDAVFAILDRDHSR